MCLSLDLNETNYLKQKHQNGFIDVYKLTSIYDEPLAIHGVFYPYKYKPGINVSDRVSHILTSDEILKREIYQGFHVVLNYDDAKSLRMYNWERVVKFKALWKDFVAAGTFSDMISYVFNRLFLETKVYEEVLGECKPKVHD